MKFLRSVSDFCSIIFDPGLTSLLVAVLIILTTTVNNYNKLFCLGFILFLNGLIPFLFYILYLQKQSGFHSLNINIHNGALFDDIGVQQPTSQPERLKPLALMAAIWTIETILAYFFFNQSTLTSYFFAGCLLSWLLLGITTFWRISIHSAWLALLAAGIVYITGNTTVALICGGMLVMIGWARVFKGRHSAYQVIAGTAAGIISLIIAVNIR